MTRRFLQLISYCRTWVGKSPNLFSLSFQEALAKSKVEAQLLGHSQVSPVHMLLALCRGTNSIGARLFERLNVSHGEVRSWVLEKVPASAATDTQPEVSFDDDFKIMMALAGRCAAANHDSYTGTQHVVAALLEQRGTAREFFAHRGIDAAGVSGVLAQLSTEAPLVD